MVLDICSFNTLVPNSHLVLFAVLGLEFTDETEEDHVGVPVHQASQVGVQIKLESSSILVEQPVMLEVANLSQFEAATDDLVGAIVCSKVVDG